MGEGNSSGALCNWLIHSVHQMRLTECDSVTQWLEDLRMMTETECMCVLQGKSLTKESSDLVFTALKSTKDSIDTIKGRAHIISSEFTKLYRRVEKERWKHVHGCGLRVICQIRSLLHECGACVPAATLNFEQQQQAVMEGCAKLAQYIDKFVERPVNGAMPDKMVLMKLMSGLGQAFSTLVDMALSYLLRTMLESLSCPASPYGLKSTLSHLVSLGLEGEHMCYLITREGGIEELFELCRSDVFKYAHAQALRAIATICCIADAIYELEKAGGVACLTELLSDKVGVSEGVRSEAAGVVAQITSPCLEQFHHLTGFIENMEDLVQSLTVLCVEASSPEVFLLGCAALANMTFMDSMACDFLSQYHTAQVLIEACMLDKAHSLFAKDQVATVLANMAAIETCCTDITDNSGTELLVHFLHERTPEGSSEAETSACERVQQKAAIALTRLCKEAEIAQIVVDLQGIPRLIQLCKEPAERNHSDSVLVACLAALRKVCSVCGLQQELSDDHDLQQLTQPKLMDSFLLCSNLDESVV